MEFIRIKILNQLILKDIFFDGNKSFYIKILIKIIYFIFIILFIINVLNMNNKFLIVKFLSSYKHFAKDCKNLKFYKRIKIKNNIPYVSICFPVYNMKNYIESAILSILT